MRPNLDLKNPTIKNILHLYGDMVLAALNAEQTVEKAVIPIYHLNQNQTKLEQIASGVLVNIKNEFFILSASHVFDQIGNYALTTGIGNGEAVIQLAGERFSSPKGKSGTHADDIIDASSYHILSDIPQSLKALAITQDNFDTTNGIDSTGIFLSSGFRVRKSNSTKHSISSKREAFPSKEIHKEDYLALGLDSNINIALWHEKQMLMNGNWQLSPKPRGFSGGAIIKVVNENTANGIVYRQKLAGIITEHIPPNTVQNIDGVLCGTRIYVHFSAIQKYLPDLFK